MNLSVDPKICLDRYTVDSSYHIERPNGSTDYLLILTLSGTGIIRIQESSFEVSRGEAVIFHPEYPQCYQTHKEADQWCFYWVHFQPDAYMFRHLVWPQQAKGLGHLKLTQNQRLNSIVKDLDATRAALIEPYEYRERLALNRLEAALIQLQAAKPDSHSPGDGRILKAIEWVLTHLNQSPSIDAIASAAGVSTSHFSALFRKETGKSVMSFVEDERMRRARAMLQYTRKPIGEIALTVGYNDPFYFSNRFRNRYNESPRAYRTKKQ